MPLSLFNWLLAPLKKQTSFRASQSLKREQFASLSLSGLCFVAWCLVSLPTEASPSPSSISRCYKVLVREKSETPNNPTTPQLLPPEVLLDLQKILSPHATVSPRSGEGFSHPATSPLNVMAQSLLNEKIAALERSYGRREVRAALKQIKDSFHTDEVLREQQNQSGVQLHVKSPEKSPDKAPLLHPEVESKREAMNTPKTLPRSMLWPLRAMILSKFNGTLSENLGAITMGHNGHLIATAEFSTAKIWKKGRKYPLVVLKGHSDQIMGLTLSRSERLLATSSRDQLIKLWNAQSGEFLGNLFGHDDNVVLLQFTPQGDELVSGSEDGTLKLWSSENRQDTHTYTFESGSPVGLEFSPNGQSIAAWTDRSQVVILDAQNLNLKNEIDFSIRSPLTSHWSTDSKLLLTSTQSGAVHIWSAKTGELVHDLTFPSGELILANFAGDNKFVLTVTPEELRSFDFKNNVTQFSVRKPLGAEFVEAGMSKDHSLLAIQDSQNTVHLIETKEGRKVATLKADKGPITHFEFSDDNSHLLISTFFGSAELWQIRPQ